MGGGSVYEVRNFIAVVLGAFLLQLLVPAEPLPPSWSDVSLVLTGSRQRLPRRARQH